MIDEAVITKRIKAVVAEELGLATVNLAPNLTAASIGRWDSMAHVRIMIGIEKEFGISLNIEDTYNLPNFGALIDYVSQQLKP